ncbi:MAG: branched-chain amino acid ABC transporter substrate-binding protein, partial [Acidobacteria bacterium]|nr:branched-chain amino acid ABC transporter substrate-binding protein [Acidobacteriota bacterium]
QLDPDETFEVDTPNQAFSLLRPGDYRIEADPDRETTVIIVFQGQGEVTGGGQAINLPQGSLAEVRGDQEITYQMHPAPEPDAWDRWCMERIGREERSQAAHYVAPETIGYEDLDAHGVWNESPYGMVWSPRTVMAGWAPYRYGHWAWIEPWGWTWIDDAPWGFAPFHYGRWAYWNNAWVWAPGPRSVRPYYSPAMVAWVGGANWQLSVSLGGGVGWVPLGPREVYYPGYHHSQGYLNRINHSNTVINNVNITNVYGNNSATNRRYLNAGAPNGISAVGQRDLAMGRPVQQILRPVNHRQLEGAQVLNNAPVAPGRGALLGPGGGGRVTRPPESVYSRRVVSRATPPSGAAPFEQRQRVLQQNPGMPSTYGGNRDGGMRPMTRQAPPVTQPVIQAQPGLQNRQQGDPAQSGQRRGWRTVTPQGQTPPETQPGANYPRQQRPPMGQPPAVENRPADQRGGWRTQPPRVNQPGAIDDDARQRRQQQMEQRQQQDQQQQRQQQDQQRRQQQDVQRQQQQDQQQQRQQQDQQRRQQQDVQRQQQQDQQQRQQQDQQRRQQQDVQRQQQQDQQQRQQQDQQRRQQQDVQRQQQQERQQHEMRQQQESQQRRQQEEQQQRRQQQDVQRQQQEERRQHDQKQRESKREQPPQN